MGIRFLLGSSSGAQLAQPDAGPVPVFNQVVVNTSGGGGTPTATFGSTPTVGDWLIAIVTTGASYAANTGWTGVETIPNCATAPTMTILYHQVQAGDGATYTPVTSLNVPTVWAIAIVDVISGRGTWATLLQQIVSNCAVTSTVTASQGAPQNTGVFAVGYINVATSGSLSADPTMTGVTGGSQTTHVNGGGGAAAGIIGAYETLTAGGFQTATATPSGAGTNINEAQAILIFLNPG